MVARTKAVSFCLRTCAPGASLGDCSQKHSRGMGRYEFAHTLASLNESNSFPGETFHCAQQKTMTVASNRRNNNFDQDNLLLCQQAHGFSERTAESFKDNYSRSDKSTFSTPHNFTTKKQFCISEALTATLPTNDFSRRRYKNCSSRSCHHTCH